MTEMHDHQPPPPTPVEGDERRSGPENESLLNLLLYKGVLPRYAFPVDVAAFYVFDAAASTVHRPVFEFTPAQGLAAALSQYAPGKEVWIASKRFTSGAIYSPFPSERMEAWKRRRLYYECTFCGYAETSSLVAGEVGEIKTCKGCGSVGTLGPARFWFRPPGFAHPVDLDVATSPDDDVARSYPTRAKLEAPSPNSTDPRWHDLNSAIRFLYARETLLVTNSGPRREGYHYCVSCGRIEPVAVHKSILTQSHKKPYPDPRRQDCDGGHRSTGVCLGTDYITDILLVQVGVVPPLQLLPGVLGTQVALRTVCEAITRAAQLLLDLEAGELEAEFRPAISEDAANGLTVEIFLYDTLAGGAGFSKRVGELGLPVLLKARDILRGCNCDSSCYRCLRSFKNRFEHHKLHRFVGLELLDFLLDNNEPTVPAARIQAAAGEIAEDLIRQVGDAIEVKPDALVEDSTVGAVRVPLLVTSGDRRLVVAITHTLSPESPGDTGLRDLAEYGTTVAVKCFHELLVQRALPSVSKQILDIVLPR